ncbi:MAG: glycosyltransferase family 4 protein, partial [Actinomycetes bacterium]
DLFPLSRPEWFTPDLARVFARHADQLLAAASRTLAISQFTADEVDRRRLGAPPTVVVPLGAELPAAVGAADLGDSVPSGDFLLVVGTVEPRKNLGLALDVFDRLAATRPDLSLVVVGRAGWSADDVVARLERHPLAGTRLHWLQGVGDATLEHLYRSATVALVPSWAEGYGLPLVEAMARRTPVVASSGGALPEVAAGFVPVVAPDDTDAWTQAVGELLDPAARAAAVARLSGFAPPSWSGCAAVVAEALLSTRG